MLTTDEKVKLHTMSWFMQRGIIEQLDPVEIPPNDSIPYYGATLPNRLKQTLDALAASGAAVDANALLSAVQDVAAATARAESVSAAAADRGRRPAGSDGAVG